MTPLRHMVRGLMFCICRLWHWVINVRSCKFLFSITSMAFSSGLTSTYGEGRVWRNRLVLWGHFFCGSQGSFQQNWNLEEKKIYKRESDLQSGSVAIGRSGQLSGFYLLKCFIELMGNSWVTIIFISTARRIKLAVVIFRRVGESNVAAVLGITKTKKRFNSLAKRSASVGIISLMFS